MFFLLDIWPLPPRVTGTMQLAESRHTGISVIYKKYPAPLFHCDGMPLERYT